jgi:TRAP-type C4-dicarboxylate transport system substrate-binding protein
MLSRRSLLGAAAAIASPVYLKEGFAQAPETTLKLHHMLPPVSVVHSRFLAPWAKTVEEASGGRLKIQIYPTMSLGGAPPQLYDQAKDGVADIVWTVPGYTAGRFPTLETVELPFIANKRAMVTGRAISDFAEKHLKNELKDIRPLAVWTHDHGLIHANKLIKTQADMAGLKLRFPTRLAGEALTALGANAIGMPVPQVPESLANKVLDGCVVPWEIVPALKLHELVKFHHEIPASPTFYVASFIVAMNNAKFDGLSNESKEVITKFSGQYAASMASKVFDDIAVENSALVVKRAGNTITQIEQGEVDNWVKATKPVWDRWMKAQQDRGVNGENLVADLQGLMKKYS